KYWAFVRVGAVEAANARGELCGRAVFFAMLLSIFSSLWRAVAQAGMPLRAQPEQMVWYLAATEWILLSAPTRHLEIQEEVRRGDVVYQLTRPFVYPRAVLAQCVGGVLVRAALLVLVALACGF